MKLPIETSPRLKRLILSGCREILTAGRDPELSSTAMETLGAIQRFVLASELPLDELGPPDVSALRDAEPGPRELATVLFTLLPLIDEIVSSERVAVGDALLAAAGLEKDQAAPIRYLIEHQYTKLRVDIFRRTFRDRFHVTFLDGMYAVLKGLLVEDPAAMRRFQAYRELPEGSFGREITRFYDDNHFSTPGSKSGFPEAFSLQHDAHHVLFGWDTSAQGEWGAATAESGCTDPASLFFLVQSFIMMQSGFAGAPDAYPRFSSYDPEHFFREFARGTRADRIIMDPDVNLVEKYASWKLDDVRHELQIAPGGNVGPGDPWCGPEGPGWWDVPLHRALVLKETRGNVVALSISGKMTDDDLETFQRIFRRASARHEHVNLMVQLQRFDGFAERATLLDDIKFGVEAASSVQRLAIVGDKAWQKWLVRMDRPFAKLAGIDERYFDIGDRADALSFVRA